MSLRSLSLFKKERVFYDLLAKKPHPNFAQRLQSTKLSGIILERFKPLEQEWDHSTKEMRLIWIQELLSALEWLEDLGYTHGDLKVHNIGIDGNNQLRLFDFGSVRHYDEEGFYEQVLEDHFTLATCIHFLASGIDPVAKANSLVEVRRTFEILKGGQGVVDEAARDFEEVIRAGWTGVSRSASSFSQLRKVVAGIIGDVDSSKVHQFEEKPSSDSQLVCDSWVVEKETRWMDEDEYCAAWKAKGYEIPDNVWG
jgi:serine/threonine protein kinase